MVVMMAVGGGCGGWSIRISPILSVSRSPFLTVTEKVELSDPAAVILFHFYAADFIKQSVLALSPRPHVLPCYWPVQLGRQETGHGCPGGKFVCGHRCLQPS